MLSSRRYSTAQRRCLLVGAADALIASARTSGNAVFLPYSFPYSFGRAGTIRAGWHSPLAQATAMGSLVSVARLTGERRFAVAATKLFNGLMSQSHPVSGGAWLQEYPTSTRSFVLNGHAFAILSAASYARETGDERGRRMLSDGALALAKLLQLYDVPTPDGAVSAYDLLRRTSGARLRARGAAVSVTSAAVVDATGRELSKLDLSSRPSPAYPVSVLAVPRVFVRVEYQGAGVLEALDGKSWTAIGELPVGGAATVEVPQRFQGRTINLRYHRMHAELLRRVARASGRSDLEPWAVRWSG